MFVKNCAAIAPKIDENPVKFQWQKSMFLLIKIHQILINFGSKFDQKLIKNYQHLQLGATLGQLGVILGQCGASWEQLGALNGGWEGFWEASRGDGSHWESPSVVIPGFRGSPEAR